MNLTKIFYFYIFSLLLFSSFSVWAGGYRVEIKQVDPEGEVRQSFCNTKLDKCSLAIPIVAKGDKQHSILNVDLIFDEDSMMFQFLWEGMYLFQKTEEKRLLRMDLPKGSVLEQVFVYVPSLEERRDDPSFAVVRPPLQSVAKLDILIEEMAP